MRAADFRARGLPRLLLLVLLMVAAAARFHRLGEQSLWYDEGISYHHALRSLPEIVARLPADTHVPAYFALLGYWEDVAGASEFSLRAFSVYCSLLGAALAYGLGARLFHPLAGLACAGFVVLNSFGVYYAAEARMYAMMSAIAVASMYLFVGLLEGRRPSTAGRARHIIALGILNVFGLYTHVSYALVMLVQGCGALLWIAMSWHSEGRMAANRPRVAVRAMLDFVLAGVLTLLLFAPWLPITLRMVFAQPNITPPIALDSLLLELAGHLAFGINHKQSIGGMGVVVICFMVFGLARPGSNWRERWRMLLPIVWVVASLSLYSYLELGLRYPRFLLPAQAALALWMGRGFWVLWGWPVAESYALFRPFTKLVAGGAVIVFLVTQFYGLPILYHDPDFQRDDIRGLVARIESELRPGDALIVSAAGFEEALRYYYRADAPVYGLPSRADGRHTEAETRAVIDGHEGLHVIFYGAAEQDPGGVVEGTLNQGAYEISEEWVDDMRYLRYAGPVAMSPPRLLDARFGEHITLHSFATNAATVGPGDALRAKFIWSADGPLEARYKVFLQLLDGESYLMAQRDSEPGGGLAKTVDWRPNAMVVDKHALLLPADLPPGVYRLIVGLYGVHEALERLPVGDGDYLELGTVRVGQSGSR